MNDKEREVADSQEDDWFNKMLEEEKLELVKSNKESDIQRERRKRESQLSIEMQAATLDLSIVCANALTGGVNNGNVEVARKKAKQAQDAYLAFEREVLSEELSE